MWWSYAGSGAVGGEAAVWTAGEDVQPLPGRHLPAGPAVPIGAAGNRCDAGAHLLQYPGPYALLQYGAAVVWQRLIPFMGYFVRITYDFLKA